VESAFHVKDSDKSPPREAAHEKKPSRSRAAPRAEEEDEDVYARTDDPVAWYLRRWARYRCSPARAKWRSPGMEDGERLCCRCAHSTVAISEILDLATKLRQRKFGSRVWSGTRMRMTSEFDEDWHVERVCRVIEKGAPAAQQVEKVEGKKTTTDSR